MLELGESSNDVQAQPNIGGYVLVKHDKWFQCVSIKSDSIVKT